MPTQRSISSTRSDGIRIRDGGDLRVEGHPFAPVFSIWTTIEECLNPPLIWEQERGWFTTEPFSEPERFIFPDGIGPVECVNVEHEEVVLVPRWLDARRVDFKYALGEDFIDVLRTLHRLGLDRTEPVRVKGVDVAPRDMVAALTPDPATLGDAFVGRAVVGTWVTGTKDGAPREVYLYQTTDAQESLREHGLQPVAYQTGFNPVLALELLADGAWSGAGVLGPEAFDPDPYLALMDRYRVHHGMVESNQAEPPPRHGRFAVSAERPRVRLPGCPPRTNRTLVAVSPHVLRPVRSCSTVRWARCSSARASRSGHRWMSSSIRGRT